MTIKQINETIRTLSDIRLEDAKGELELSVLRAALEVLHGINDRKARGS